MDQKETLITPEGPTLPVAPSAEVAQVMEVGDADHVSRVESEHVQVVGLSAPLNSQHVQEVQIDSSASQGKPHKSIWSRITGVFHHAGQEAAHEVRTNVLFAPFGPNDTESYKNEYLRSRGIDPDQEKEPEETVPPITTPAVPENSWQTAPAAEVAVQNPAPNQISETVPPPAPAPAEPRQSSNPPPSMVELAQPASSNSSAAESPQPATPEPAQPLQKAA